MKFSFRNLLVVIGIMASSTVIAQKITITGNVTDTLANPLQMANVVAVNKATNALDGFGITNSEGLYRINVNVSSDYTLKVSFLGFQAHEIPVSVKEQDLRLDVVLQPETEQLEGVELVYEIPVTVKGDTIVYNTDSFVSGTEKKLADVLDKLPGVEVNDDGEIEVEGKTVTKVMVEGEDFFDGDSKLASENIPANALDKVEVLRNYSEVSQLSGVTNNQDNIALNIKLKEGKKKFWFGEVSGGIGLDERYIVNPKLFYYSPNFSVNILTDLNNIGDIPFSSRDFWRFTGGFRGATRSNNGTTFNTSASGSGLSLMQNNRAKEINSKFGAINFSYKPSDTWRFSGFGIYSYTNTLMETQATKTYIADNSVENTQANSDQTSKLGLIKLASNYKPSNKFQFDYDILMRLSDEDEDENTLSVSDVTDNIYEGQSQKPSTITQNANFYYTANDDHIFALEAEYEYSDENPFYNAIRTEQPFQDVIPFDTNQNEYNIGQNQYTQTNRADAKLDYFWVTGPKSNLNFTLGTTYSSQRFNSSIFQILDNDTELDFDDEELNNEVEFDFADLFFGFHYKVVMGKLTLNPGFHVHSYSAKNTQLGTEVKDGMVNIVPDLFMDYQFKQSENLRLTYTVQRNFSDINSFAQGYIFSNYNSLYQGNRDLESALYHNVSLNFFSFNMFNMQNIFASASYSKRIDAFKSNTGIAGINQVNTTINSNLEDETLSGDANFQRTFGRVKVTGRVGLNYSNTYNIINDSPQNSRSFTQNYTASVGTSFTKAPNVELGYRYAVNDYNTGAAETTFYTDRPFVKFDAAFLNGFILLADYDYYFYRDKAETVENKYGFLNASLSYQKPESKWEYSLNVTNLTGNQELNEDSFNDLFFRTSAYIVQPRYVVFKVKYDL